MDGPSAEKSISRCSNEESPTPECGTAEGASGAHESLLGREAKEDCKEGLGYAQFLFCSEPIFFRRAFRTTPFLPQRISECGDLLVEDFLQFPLWRETMYRCSCHNRFFFLEIPCNAKRPRQSYCRVVTRW